MGEKRVEHGARGRTEAGVAMKRPVGSSQDSHHRGFAGSLPGSRLVTSAIRCAWAVCGPVMADRLHNFSGLDGQVINPSPSHPFWNYSLELPAPSKMHFVMQFVGMLANH